METVDAKRRDNESDSSGLASGSSGSEEEQRQKQRLLHSEQPKAESSERGLTERCGGEEAVGE
jgi:hypothetical protein